MKVTVSDLQEMTREIFHHLEELDITSIEIDHDFYWNVPEDQLYDPYKEPDKLDLGQLSDDWNDLQGVLRGERNVVTYNLVDLAAILKAIGEKITV